MAVLEPLLPTAKRPGRPSLWTKRQLIDGMRWRVRLGAPWRDVPVEYGSWSAVYALFRRWQRDGTWRQIVTALQCLADAAGLTTKVHLACEQGQKPLSIVITAGQPG